jgi:hypothetical protein
MKAFKLELATRVASAERDLGFDNTVSVIAAPHIVQHLRINE